MNNEDGPKAAPGVVNSDTPEQEGEHVESHQPLQIVSSTLPHIICILPVNERPVLPVQTLPVSVPEQPWLSTFAEVAETPQHALGLLLSRDSAQSSAATASTQAEAPVANTAVPNSVDALYQTGSVVRVHQANRNEGMVQFVAEGVQRFRVLRWISREPPLKAQVVYLEDIEVDNAEEVKAYARALLGTLRELISLNPLFNEEVRQYLERFTPNQPSFLAWFAATLTTATGAELQRLLEIDDLKQRLDAVLALLKKELDVARLHADLKRQVDEKISDQQRQFFLKEQLKIIQNELGLEKDDKTAELERLKARLQNLALNETAAARVEDELKKLSVLELGSPEYAVTRNYLDWITSLPWGVESVDQLDLGVARKVLDERHSGLDDVKTRILEFLAMAKLRGEITGSIILLVGPPGVGKTSIGRSIAEAMEREFFRFSVGGMRDEAEIKGHRRTYIGAMPGKFIQALKTAGTSNPVLMIDEIDKIGASYQGDPAAALLEVLDPEQNAAFLDHYLDVPFDLSKVLFVCTANQLDTIPAPLLDRMEVIRLSGYITEEKLDIAKKHLWPALIDRSGISKSKLAISDAGLRAIIDGYAREAGVRGLEKQLSRIVRKVAVAVLSDDTTKIRISGRNVADYLGTPPFEQEESRSAIGVVTGLAWTAMGGATLSVEASRVHDGARGLMLTGNLGDVMRESAQIAYSYVSANLEDFPLKRGNPGKSFFSDAHIHLHVPAGATPKDGPSAGITMALALVSLSCGRPTRARTAMTGELTLTGQVSAVGGIREKVVAARRAKIKRIILPKSNEADAMELPAYVRDGLEFHFIAEFTDLLPLALGA